MALAVGGRKTAGLPQGGGSWKEEARPGPAVNPPSHRLAGTRFFDGGAGGLPRNAASGWLPPPRAMENERAGEGRGGGDDGRKTPDQPQRGFATVASGFSRGRGRTGGHVRRAHGRMMRARGQPAESQTRLVAFFLTEELAIDYETPPADGSLPRERTCMSGRGRAGERTAPAGLGNGSPWLQPRAGADGRRVCGHTSA